DCIWIPGPAQKRCPAMTNTAECNIMRLLIVGTLGGQLTIASKIAMDKGASVIHAESNEQALAVLRSGRGADLLFVDVSLDIRDLVNRLDAERIHVPIVACGVTNDARAAVRAI